MTEKTPLPLVGKPIKHPFFAFFIGHPVLANVVMMLMIGAGFVGINKLNTQFFPTFEIDIITIGVLWPGANSEDVEASVTNPIELNLEGLEHVKKIASTSSQGYSSILIEYETGTDMITALDKVTQRVSEVNTLPEDAETPTVKKVDRYDDIAKLVITGGNISFRELRKIADKYSKELNDFGVSKTATSGVPEMQLHVSYSLDSLNGGDITLPTLSNQLAAQSVDIPAGNLGEKDGQRNLRAIEQKRTESDVSNLYYLDDTQNPVPLSETGKVELLPVYSGKSFYVRGNPAVEILVNRSGAENTFGVAEKMNAWLEKTRPELPEGIELIVFDEEWKLVNDRLSILLKNAGSGILLVGLVLFLFLNSRIAFWVAMGIPISFLFGIFVLYLLGGSINMISMFALIMALGIVVDDSIVVGESTMSFLEKGQNYIEAPNSAALTMFIPVFAAVLTTIAAFAPLMLVEGIIGTILFDIPLVIITVLIAALFECFLVLPHHLKSSLKKADISKPNVIRRTVDKGFDFFKEKICRPIISFSLSHRSLTLAVALSLMIASVGLLAGGRIQFVFFPSVPARIIYADVMFEPATPAVVVNQFLNDVEKIAYEVEEEFQEDVIKFAMVERFNEGASRGGKITFELIPSNQRETTNSQFKNKMNERVPQVPGLTLFKIAGKSGGPPGQDVQIKLFGAEVSALKQASLDIQEVLKSVPGVINLEDDLPYGRDSLVFSLTTEGYSAGFTIQNVMFQIGQMLNGVKTYSYSDDVGSQDVYVILDKKDRDSLDTLNNLFVRTGSGESYPLPSIVDWEYRRGFDSLKHIDGELTIQVLGDVDIAQNTPNQILAGLARTTMPAIQDKYGIQYSFEGASANQKETLSSMLIGLVVGICVMYFILSVVFGSWFTPLFVMIAIPFGLIGGLLGHYLTGLNMTILSLFGFFAVSGIVVNNSIIFVSTYNLKKKTLMDKNQALLDTALERLRPIIVTSLTTIGGLMPLLFETSLQAQFLIPMATSIIFGLSVSTFLVLILLPAQLSIYENSILGLVDRIKGRSDKQAGSDLPGAGSARDFSSRV